MQELKKLTTMPAPVLTGFTTMSPIARASQSQVVQLTPAQNGDFIVPAGTTAVYDAAHGDLSIQGKLVVHGTLRVISSKIGIQDLTIEVNEVTNDGSIESKLSGTTRLKGTDSKNLKIHARGGYIRAAGSLSFKAAGHICIHGGNIVAGNVHFETAGQLTAQVESIDAPISIDADKTAIGVDQGDLNITHQTVHGDPIYYSTNGSVTVPDLSGGVIGDVVAWAKKNVTTSGIKASGNIWLTAGVSSYTWLVTPVPSSGGPCGVTPCSKAWQLNGHSNAGSVTVNGNLESTGGGYILALTGMNSVSDKVAINGTVTTNGSWVFLWALGTVKCGSIATGTSGASGAVCIYAYAANPAAPLPFIIGGSGNANGVNGTISVVNPIADVIPGNNGFVAIYNGGNGSSNNGGITVSNATDITISIGGSKNGVLSLVSPSNPITLPAGTFSVDGLNGNPAGRMYIGGWKLITAGTTLTASEAAEPGSGQQHHIHISAATVTSNGNLTVKADGKSDFAAGGGANVAFYPQFVVYFNVTVYPNLGQLSITPSETGANGNVVFDGVGTVTAQALGRETEIEFWSSWGAGSGKSIAFNGGNVTVNANGRSNSDAGKVVINTDAPVTVAATTLLTVNANGDGTGEGGSVSINNTGSTAMTLSNLVGGVQQVRINAKAGTSGSGVGGKVSITKAMGPNVSTPINVNAAIIVDGGTGLLGAAEGDYGRITINGVPCQQRTTGFASWPKTYWNSVNPDGSTADQSAIKDAANSLGAALKGQLGNTLTPSNSSIQIYVMSAIDSNYKYLGLPLAQPHGVYGFSVNSIRVSAVFSSIYDSTGSPLASTSAYPSYSAGSPTILQGALIHELGHQLDYIWGNLSTKTPFGTKLSADMATLQNASIPCTAAFTANTCAYAPFAALANNYARFQALGYATSDFELFPTVFEHLESAAAGTYGVFPDLEMVIGTQCTQMQSYVQGLINSPPNPVN